MWPQVLLMPLPSWRRNNREDVIKGFVIAGTGSGSGKTTLSLAVMAYLEQQGHTVAPFKVGPDFIDPGHHRALTGRNSRNLDSWMLSKAYNQGVFAQGCLPCGADMAVVEGVMGLFDGYSGVSEAGSTAQMAKWLGLPVILVVDARSMARSAAAIVQGFENFDPDLNFAGVIFSKTGSPRHYAYLKEAVEATCKMPCLGHMPRNEKIVLPERHLGLVTSDEHGIPPDVVSELVSMVDRYTTIGALAATLPDLGIAPEKKGHPPVESQGRKRVRIAVARDKAFCFYYPENLEALEAAGAEIVRFSPLEDRVLPENIHGIYLGGGYPELFAKQLSDNQTLLREIRQKSRDAMPIYGECGGFMYLCNTLTAMDSKESFEMAGCFPFSVSMSKRLRSLGYREIALAEDTLVGRKGEVLRGHEFHYSSLDDDGVPPEVKTVYAVSLRDGTRTATAGFQVENTLGSYLHIHFGSLATAAGRFADQCRDFRDRGERP
ncbi:MAG: cobyrinate a,c-diamide synthase [Desulfobacterium sp.]|nr:cobyrinate a,c-diamide synthase [Desulfobacterium sp.]